MLFSVKGLSGAAKLLSVPEFKISGFEAHRKTPPQILQTIDM
jgi:hypothetical protein